MTPPHAAAAAIVSSPVQSHTEPNFRTTHNSDVPELLFILFATLDAAVSSATREDWAPSRAPALDSARDLGWLSLAAASGSPRRPSQPNQFNLRSLVCRSPSRRGQHVCSPCSYKSETNLVTSQATGKWSHAHTRQLAARVRMCGFSEWTSREWLKRELGARSRRSL